MNTGSMIVGSCPSGLMVCTVPGAPAILNLMVSRPASPAGASPELALLLAAVIASRSVTKPSTAIESPVLVTVRTAGTARTSSGSTPNRVGRKCRDGRRFLVDPVKMRASQLPNIPRLLVLSGLSRRGPGGGQIPGAFLPNLKKTFQNRAYKAVQGDCNSETIAGFRYHAVRMPSHGR